MTGWQVQFGYLVTIQPVGTDEARHEALARWSALPGYIDTEIANLREGLRLGYSAPKGIVRIVIDQMNTPDREHRPPTRHSCRRLQRDKTPEFPRRSRRW